MEQGMFETAGALATTGYAAAAPMTVTAAGNNVQGGPIIQGISVLREQQSG